MSVDTSTCIPAAGIRHLIVHDDLQPRFAPKSNKWGQVSMERCISIRVAFHEVTVAVDLSIHIRPVYLQKDALVFQVLGYGDEFSVVSQTALVKSACSATFRIGRYIRFDHQIVRQVHPALIPDIDEIIETGLLSVEIPFPVKVHSFHAFTSAEILPDHSLF